MSEYMTNTEELTLVADAIRSAGGTSASLSYPQGFANALSGIDTWPYASESHWYVEAYSSAYSATPVATQYIAFVSYPDVTSLSTSVYMGRSYLREAKFPALTTIPYQAFKNCTALEKVSFPAVTAISVSTNAVNKPFYGCTALTDLSFPELLSIKSTTFNQCGVQRLYAPKCSTIEQYGLNGASSIAKVTLRDCVSIQSFAFSGCEYLRELYLLGSSVATLTNSNAFNNTPIGGYSSTAGSYGSIYVPATLLSEYQAAANWSSFESRFVGLTESEINAL